MRASAIFADAKDELPQYSKNDELSAPNYRRQHWQRRRFVIRAIVISLLSYTVWTHWHQNTAIEQYQSSLSKLSFEKLQAQHDHCAALRAVPQDPNGHREQNARFNGAKDVLIKGATVWTGEARSGEPLQWKQLDVLLHNGLISRVEDNIALSELAEGALVHNGTGRLLSTGIIDMHTHAGVATLPDTRGGNDDNELSNDITPYVRSLDALNPLDPQIQVIKSGGVTTSLVLPGSGNNIGGQAFVIKHAVGKQDGRPEISATDMLADPEQNWRYMKMACGENAKRVYGQVARSYGPFSRMGEAWYFRHAFEQAQKLVTAQNDWCAAADELGVDKMTEYLPLDLEWEALGAVLRGQVHVNTHCYTVPDLEAFIRHSNEFKFPVRAFHHAHQTYLVPEILKRNYGGRPPAAALFADNMYYKTESYIGSEQAGKILHENGITPVYVSDNPVINAQHVVFEAAKAHKYGLPYEVALAGVTTAPAELLGLGERIGKIKAGFDADLTLWDSDPLSVGATPVQVWIDGAAQFDHPVELKKPAAKPLAQTEHVDKAVQSNVDGAEQSMPHTSICFSGISHDLLSQTASEESTGRNLHINLAYDSVQLADSCNASIPRVDLENGYVVKTATAFGSLLGLEEISAEPSTNDGRNNADTYSAAVDGLALDSKTLKAAFSHGVTRAITAPPFRGGGRKGSSVGFNVNAKHALEKGAIWNPVVSVHYSLEEGVKGDKTPSLSSAIAELKFKLLGAIQHEGEKRDPSYETENLDGVVEGRLPLVISVHKADTIAALLTLKKVVDTIIAREWKGKKAAPKLRLVILGGAEAHLLATELAEAEVGVVLAPAFPYATEWEQRRSLTGAPLTNGTAIDVLHAAGVTLALGASEDWQTRDLFLFAGIAHINSGGKISAKQALDMVSGNIYKMLGLSTEETGYDDGFLVFDGNPLEMQSQLRAAYDGSGSVHVWS